MARVPRTEEERQQVLAERPPAWEYLYFAGQLLYEREKVEEKYRDHEIRYAPSTGEIVEEDEVFDYIGIKATDAQNLAQKLQQLVTNEDARERAFGAPGEPGDPDRIAHLANRWNSVYEEFIDWAARLRGVSVDSSFRPLLELLARYAEKPVEQYREFVDRFVSQADELPAVIAAGGQPQLSVSLHLSIDEDAARAFEAELEKVASL